MSKNRGKNGFHGKSSTDLRNEYNDVSFKLGLEIANERRAVENQETLKDRQSVLEEAFNDAMAREQEFARKQAEADAKTKAAEEKAKANGVADRTAETADKPETKADQASA